MRLKAWKWTAKILWNYEEFGEILKEAEEGLLKGVGRATGARVQIPLSPLNSR